MLTLIDLIQEDSEYSNFQVYAIEEDGDYFWMGKAEIVAQDCPLAEVVGVNNDTGELDVRL